VVNDDAGMLLVSKRGTLKAGPARRTKRAMSWVPKGKKPVALTSLYVQGGRSLLLIFDDLGVYFGKKRGTPCDWF